MFFGGMLLCPSVFPSVSKLSVSLCGELVLQSECKHSLITSFPHSNDFERPWKRRLLKTLWEKNLKEFDSFKNSGCHGNKT